MLVYNYKNYIWGITYLNINNIDPMIEIKMLKTPDFENNNIINILKRTNKESKLVLLVYPETCQYFEILKNKIKYNKKLEIISNIPQINYFCEDILQHIHD